MKQEKFQVINFIRELIIHIDNNLDNFPKKDIELKNRIRKRENRKRKTGEIRERKTRKIRKGTKRKK